MLKVKENKAFCNTSIHTIKYSAKNTAEPKSDFLLNAVYIKRILIHLYKLKIVN